MAKQLLEIRAIITEAQWRVPDSDFFFGKGRLVDASNGKSAEPISLVGNANQEDLALQLEYLLYGSWRDHPKYGRQFNLATFVRSQPHGRTGTINYLKQAPNVGVMTASALWDKFGGDAVRILRESPDVASAAVGGQFTIAKAEEAAGRLQELVALENCTIELFDLFDGLGYPKGTSPYLIRRYGNKAPRIVKGDPYKLLACPGIGFPRADKLYQELGLPAGRLKRQAMCAAYTIHSDREGHTWHPILKAVGGIEAMVGGAELKTAKAIRLAVRAKLLAIRTGECECKRRADQKAECPHCRGTGSRLWVADYGKSESERKLAEYIAAASLEKSCWAELLREGKELGCFDKLTTHQMEQLTVACGGGAIAILGGSPGTGKTFTAAAFIRAIIESYGTASLAVAAPTGKAAVRLTEALGEYDLQVSATTIHRMLQVEQVGEGGFSFYFGPATASRPFRPLPKKFIVLDEQSMTDTRLMLDIFGARERGTHILCIGDINQLPPIQHGAPLRDMIAAGLPYGELTEPHRNAGTIVRACHQIRRGEPFDVDEKLAVNEVPPKNLTLKLAIPALAPRVIINILRQIAANGNSDPIWDCQVICAVNAKSPLARKTLNKALQNELNPHGRSKPGCPFRVGDKVMQLKNKFLKLAEHWEVKAVTKRPPASASALPLDIFSEGESLDDLCINSNSQALVCNGQFGRVLEIDETHVFIEFLSPMCIVKVPYFVKAGGGKKNGGSGDDDESGAAGDLDLAYACTCHKLQGSQAKIVIVALDEYPGATGRFGICKREWIYTALSRAQKACFLVGKMATAEVQCREQALPGRKTFLTELIRAEQQRLTDLANAGRPRKPNGQPQRLDASGSDRRRHRNADRQGNEADGGEEVATGVTTEAGTAIS
jgi:exodeoxyribonuclease V alpha subunit